MDGLRAGNARLRELAERDWLTGLYNRGSTEQRVGQAMQSWKGGAMLVLDIDWFKQVNDQYGHLMGDEILRDVARTLECLFFQRDIVGRVGGDEFAVYVTADCTAQCIEGKVARVRALLEEARIKTEKGECWACVGGLRTASPCPWAWPTAGRGTATRVSSPGRTGPCWGPKSAAGRRGRRR